MIQIDSFSAAWYNEFDRKPQRDWERRTDMKAQLFGIALLGMGCFFLLLSDGYSAVLSALGMLAGGLGVCVSIVSLFFQD